MPAPIHLAAIFLAPAVAAAGVAAVAVPLAIHLLSRSRRRTEPWAAMRFLMQAYQRQRRRLRLEQWLLLALRCLIVLCLGLALAGPVAGRALAFLTGRGGGPVVHVILDDALASGVAAPRAAGAPGRGGDRLAGLAADAAGALEADLPAAARVSVWSLATGTVMVRDVTPAAAAAALTAARPAPRGRAWSDTLAAVEGSIGAAAGPAEVRIVSSWSRGRPPAAGRALPSGLAARAAVRVTRPMDAAPNTQVAAVLPATGVVVRRDGAARVAATVRLRRFGGAVDPATDRIHVRLWGPDRGGAGPARVLAETRVEHRWAGTDATAAVRVSLSVPAAALGDLPRVTPLALSADLAPGGADRLALDNHAAATLELRPSWRVGVVDRAPVPDAGARGGIAAGTWWALALTAGERDGWSVVPLSPRRLTDRDLGPLDAVVIAAADALDDPSWAAVGGFARGGGLVWLTPPVAGGAGDGAPAAGSSDWTARAATALGLDWRFALSAAPVDAAPIPGPTPAEPLRRLSADWPALLADVRISRAWPVGGVEAAQVWAALPGGAPWIAADRPDTPGGGWVVWIGSALSAADSNLPSRPLLVALAREVTQRIAGGAPRPGIDPRAALAAAWQPVPLTDGAAPADGVPVDTDGAPLWRPAGIYADAAGDWHAVVADADAGDTTALTQDGLRALLGGAPGAASWSYLDEPVPAGAASAEPTLRWPLLWVTLALVLVEALAARAFSHATTSRGPGRRAIHRPTELFASLITGGRS